MSLPRELGAQGPLCERAGKPLRDGSALSQTTRRPGMGRKLNPRPFRVGAVCETLRPRRFAHGAMPK
jgi:hypothetical protein